MIRRLPFLLVVAALGAPAMAGAQAQPTAECSYDREAMLKLDVNAFDQDTRGGWRMLADRGCFTVAADLIRAYRTAHPQHALLGTRGRCAPAPATMTPPFR